MLPPKSPRWTDIYGGGQIIDSDEVAFDKLIPKTTIDHLLSEEERRKAAEERREFEAVGRRMGSTKSLYQIVYECVRQRLSGGMSEDEIRVEMAMFPAILEDADQKVVSVIREAYADALAGRPPRFSLPF